VGDENDHGEDGTTCEFLDGDWPKLNMLSHGKPNYSKPKNASIMPCTSSMISQVTKWYGWYAHWYCECNNSKLGTYYNSQST